MQAPLIHVWKDENCNRSAAENMAVDELLFLSAIETNTVRARFYNWSAPAVTFGYSQQVPTEGSVRRMTGGGIVEHGEDLTYTLAYPKDTAFAGAAGAEARYRWVHQTLADALGAAGVAVGLLPSLEKPDGPCFAAPVRWDVIDSASGKKIAGGAQRRSRGAIIHQGSIRLDAVLRSPDAAWIDRFLSLLANSAVPFTKSEKERLNQSARSLESRKYGTAEWNRR